MVPLTGHSTVSIAAHYLGCPNDKLLGGQFLQILTEQIMGLQ